MYPPLKIVTSTFQRVGVHSTIWNYRRWFVWECSTSCYFLRVLAPISNIRPQTLHGERLKCVSVLYIFALNIHVPDLFPVECLGANIWNGSQHSQKITGAGTLSNRPSPEVSDRRVHSNTLNSGCHYFQWFNRGFYRQIRTLRISDLRNLLYDPMTDTYLKENWNSMESEKYLKPFTHSLK